MAKKKTTTSAKLSAADYDPLLIAASSRSVDTCLLGARCLALLGDPRALGLLMQLSREESAEVRLETCRSFEQLGDRQAIDRLCALLDDDDVKVRDAAFSALAKICTAAKIPLEAAQQGLAVSHEDVRMRGLELLVRHAKKSKANLSDDAVGELLKQTLNDSKTVRSESFKFVLNSRIGGDHESALRFALQSRHSDVRTEVLTELIAEEKQPWAYGLAIDMLDDPDESVRTMAFEHLQKQHKDAGAEKKLAWLSAAIETPRADIRLLACQRLVKINTTAAQSVIGKAIEDEDNNVRQFALRSLIDRGAKQELIAALQSEHIGIKLSAATALSRQGESAARPVLEEFVSVPMPDRLEVGDERVEVWQQITTNAIAGLAALEDPATLPVYVSLCSHENEMVRREAAKALRNVVDEKSIAELQPLLRSDDEHVQQAAAFACSLYGDLGAGRSILASSGESPVSSSDRLCAAIALGSSSEIKLIQLLDESNNIQRPNTVLLVLLCRDWLDHDGTPRRIVAALAARDARLRLLAARALQSFSDSKALGEVIAYVFNHRIQSQSFEIDSKVIHAVACVLVFGRGPLLCHLIDHLDTLSESKQDKWDTGWQWLSQRYASEIKEAQAKAKKQKLKTIEPDAETLDQLAFGTYVGLAREHGGYHALRHQPHFGWSIANVREEALRRLRAMAQDDKSYLEPVVSVVTHTCGDPLQSVRLKAFEILEELGVEDQTRAEIAINSRQLDLAVKGLSLLTSSVKKSERKAILTQTILNESSSMDRQRAAISLEAASMLKEEIGSVATCKICLDASPAVALKSVSWVADDFESDDAAKKLIRELAADAPQAVRERAIDSLVKNKDEQAFDAIVSVASETNPKIDRSRCFSWFSELGDSRASEFLLGLFDNPDFNIDTRQLLLTVGQLRDVAAVPRLLELMERDDLRSGASTTISIISGFSQQVLDPDDQWPDRLWVDAQHPRHGDILAALMMRHLELNATKMLDRYIRDARWCLTSEVDPPLSRLVEHSDEKLRRLAVEAVSFRAEKRDGDIESLQKAVEQRDPVTQFLAAEGLAKAGNADGMSVLLSAAEMMDDLSFRRRAVLALGRLADERALDPLLKWVTHDGHALQDSAAEAIGPLGKSEHREKVLKILLGLVAREGSAGPRAIVGLRHMDVSEGWDEIRKLADSQIAGPMRNFARQQLGYDSSDATKDLLIQLLESHEHGGDVNVMASARRCFGHDSIIPDVAFLKGRHHNEGPLGELELECLKRICETADPAEIFELVSRCPPYARRRLTHHLLSLDPLPIDQATTALADPDSQTVRLAAHVVGRHGDKKQAKSISDSLEHWMQRYCEMSEMLNRTNTAFGDDLLNLYKVCSQLIWAASRVGGADKQLLAIVTEHLPDRHFRNLRRAAMRGLQNAKLTAAQEKQLLPLLEDYDAQIRDLAGELLVKKETNQQKVAEALLADRRPFDRMAASEGMKFTKTLTTAAESAHYQARALPHLIAEKDHKTLSAVARDEQRDLPTRLGAIEGLARMAEKAAEKTLLAIGKDEKTDDALRKAAWRGLRSKRAKAIAS